MKVHLLQARRALRVRTNKDTNGGYGTVNEFGSSLTSRLLSAAKARGMNFPELAPAYAAAILRARGHSVTYGENETNPDADVTLLQSSLVHFNEERRQARALKSRRPRMRVGFFGGVCDTLTEELLEVSDFVVRGEFEAALSDGDLADFDGVAYSGKVDDLDTLPYPSWDHVSLRAGYPLVSRLRDARLAPMLASRGCPLSCRYYCTYPLVQGVKQRSRSVGNLVGEIEYLRDVYGVNLVLFRDPIFTLDMERTKAFCCALLELGERPRYIIETHTRFIDEEMVRLLAESGCVAVQLGIESGNAEVMRKSLRRSDSFENQEYAIRALERRGIKVLALFMLAYFDDTEATVEQTIDHALRLNPYGAQFTVATPYPGTPWYEHLKKENGRYRLSEDYDDYTQYRLVYDHPHLSAEDVERLKNRAYRRFYCRPSYLRKHHVRAR